MSISFAAQAEIRKGRLAISRISVCAGMTDGNEPECRKNLRGWDNPAIIGGHTQAYPAGELFGIGVSMAILFFRRV